MDVALGSLLIIRAVENIQILTLAVFNMTIVTEHGEYQGLRAMVILILASLMFVYRRWKWEKGLSRWPVVYLPLRHIMLW